MAVFCLISAAAAPALAEPGVPMVNGSIIRDYKRITFQWPETVLFRSESSGNKIIIHFDRAASPDFGGVLSGLRGSVIKAELSADKKTVTFTTDKPYRTRTFISGNTAGLDLLEPGKEPVVARKSAPKPVEEEPSAGEVKEAKKDANLIKVEAAKAESIKPPKAKPAQLAEKVKPAKTVEKIKPVTETAKEESIKPPKEKPAVTAEKNKPAPVVETKVAEAKKEEKPVATEAKAEAEKEKPAEAATKPDEKKPDATVAEKPAEPEKPAPPSTNAAGEMLVRAEPAKNGFILHFPWDKRVASAVFKQSGNLWVVFNENTKFNFDQLKGFKQDSIGAPEITTQGGFAILRFPMEKNFFTKVIRKDKEFDWQVEISSVPRHLGLSIPITTNTAPPLKPHVFLSVLEFVDPITVIDPAQGVPLSITPLFKGGVGVSPERKFVEATILVSAQGVIVEKNTDDIRLALQRNGIKITRPQGITLTPGLPQLEPEVALSGDDTLFPYDRWKPSSDEKFEEEMSKLKLEASKANTDMVNRIRTRMAQMYLAQGMDGEALGMLRVIRESDPEFYVENRLNALSGAANFLMYRISEAATDFAAPELEGIPEIDMWRVVCDSLLGMDTAKFDYKTNDKTYISKYPPSFRQKLAIIAADLSINRKDYNGALRIFDSLNNDRQMAPIQKYVDFMIATISAETGQYAAAFNIWDKMSKNYDDRFMRARAEFSLVGMLIKQGKIKPEEAIRRLDQLRIVWRDDNFELNLLSLLGQMYYDNKDYLNALRTWREIVTVFPQLPDATTAAQKMAETFSYLFSQGGADTMKPFDALALYYEFPELMPLGKAGDKVKENIADTLAQVDLLDKATEILNNLVQFRLDGVDRSRVGAKLALFYLLNHQPQMAIDTLQGTGYGANPNELRDTRNHLSAQAFTELGRHQEALAALDNDFTPDALALKMNVYWEKKDWQNVISLGEQVLGTRQDITAALTPNETDYLMKLALAYSFLGDRVQMQYLRDYFGPLVTDPAQKDMFMFVTRTEEPLDTRNFASISTDLSSIQSFLDKYRTEVKQGNIDSVIQ